MSDNAPENEKKIIVDDDWKSQVQAEKEALEQQQQQQAEAPPEGQMPPASFPMLLTTLATEAMVALGQIPHPATGKAEQNLEAAKYFIDTLGMLEEKTQGNLETDESQSLTDVLHQLRMAFVAMKNAATVAAPAAPESKIVHPE